jgi:biopolymer transport protein ExbD
MRTDPPKDEAPLRPAAGTPKVSGRADVGGRRAADGRAVAGDGVVAGASAAMPVRPRRKGGYRYARRRRRRTPAVLSLNLTAMIDTVFNLLFFFMIASRFGAIEGLLPAQLPAKASASAAPATPVAEVPRTPIRVRLLPDPASPARCRATIDGLVETPVEMAALPAALARIHGMEGFNDSRVPVYLLAGDDVAWDHVVNAYNAAMSTQYERIFFAGAP